VYKNKKINFAGAAFLAANTTMQMVKLLSFHSLKAADSISRLPNKLKKIGGLGIYTYCGTRLLAYKMLPVTFS